MLEREFDIDDIVIVDDEFEGKIVRYWGTDNYEVEIKEIGIKSCKTKDLELKNN